MKHLAWFAALLLVFSVFFAASAEDRISDTQRANGKLDDTLFGELNSTDTYKLTLKLEKLLNPPKDNPNYRVQQGCATDGTYAYFILENQTLHLGSIWKLDMKTWDTVAVRYDLPIDHGNDMTYNSKTNQLIVVNNKPNYQKLTFIDPEMLEITDTRMIDLNTYAIAYDEINDRYATGVSGGYDYAVWSPSFSLQHVYTGENTHLTRQGGDCDSKYIYFPQNNSSYTKNVLAVYDWDGNFINTIKVDAKMEIESMFHVGNEVWIAFNCGGCVLYKADALIVTHPAE